MPNVELDLADVIRDTRAAAGPMFVKARVEAEAEARELLDKFAGAMTSDRASQLGKILNRHYWSSGVRFNRFLPGLSQPLIDQMVADIDQFNAVVNRLWRAEEFEATAEADRIFKEGSYLPGAGQSFPSILLYLRFPDRYFIWFSRVDRGLAAVTDYEGNDRKSGIEGYTEFCDVVGSLVGENDVAPQEVDAILSEVARRAAAASAEDAELAATPTITTAAFEFLSDLGSNNTREWFDANRSRYERDIRDPVASVLEAVAAEFVRGLDPKLNTTVQRDDVLARINKYAPGDPYYTYYWGAFSRGKKQEDIQLYFSVASSHLEYGLFLASASTEVRERIAERAETLDPIFIESLADHLPDLMWDQGEGQPTLVSTPEDLANWARGPHPRALRMLAPDHELIGSSALVDDVGRVLVALYSLAALGWEEEADVDVATPVDEDLRPEYTFDQLLSETRLPAEQLEEWLGLLRGDKRAGLFYGPPGTGKTWVVERLAKHLAGTEGEYTTVQFHPSFSYEDFIEGLRPTMEKGQLTYEIRDGIFKRFCDEARGKNGDYVFVVDEINRAELGAVLGEVMMLVEYRGRTVPLPYSHEPFSIPKNVVLLATMNTADRSLALVDFALRRRFHAFRMPPDRDVLGKALGANGELAVQMFDLIQEFVSDPNFAPGHSYWMTDDPSAATLHQIWRYELRPYLEEYWFESRTRLDELEKKVETLLGEGV